jgi:SpoVK/Ycf46/Vps4 family AAA+-type ATPase
LKRQLEAIKSSPNVFFVAATNHLDRIDPNIRANKRLPLQIGIGLPGEDQRRELLAQLIVKQHLKNINLDGLDAPEQLTKVEAWLPAINQVVETTQGFSYGEISTILTDAKRRRFLDSVSDPSKASSDILSIEEVRQAVNRFRHSKN